MQSNLQPPQPPKKQQEYFQSFKEEIQKKVVQLEFQQEKQKIQELLEFIYEFPPFQDPAPISNSQPPKKRVKPPVKLENRCRAKLSNGGQCSRQRLKDGQLCGSHNKVQPYGILCSNSQQPNSLQNPQTNTESISHEVFAVEIQGLVYYIDQRGNVFHTEDVLNDVLNPAIIAQYIKTPSGYSIPALGLY